ncbi:MAG: transcriptional regulator [Ferruginibacter sp.]|nr:transcriptional regulator [Ferruginibacter sp.]
MLRYAIAILILLTGYPVASQNTIGLPQIINYNNSDFHGGTQTWDIKQDKNGIMYFANNEGLISFNGSHWSVYPLPNKTVVRSLFIDKDNKIYVGAQDEFGYYTPDASGNLHYISLKNLIPKPLNQFADIWDIESYGESIFFRATDRIFELRNNSIQVFPSGSEWRFIKQVGSKLIAQDKTQGLLQYKNNGWYPLGSKAPFDNLLVSGIIELGSDHYLISTLKNGLFDLKNGIVSKNTTDADQELVSSQSYTLAAMNKTEFVVGTTSEGCLIMNFKGEIVQKIAHAEGLQNNNVLCLFLDDNKNLWAGLNNGISYIAYNSAIKYIRPNKTNDLSGYSTRIYDDRLYIATSDGAHSVPLSNQNKDLSFSKGDFTQIKNSTGQVWQIDEVNQQLLMGYNDGVFMIRGNEAYPIKQGTGAWLFVPTSSIFPSATILAGTYNGLEMLGSSGNSFTDLGKIEGANESLRFLAMDNNNDIWASHPYRGVFKMQLSTDQKKCTVALLTAKDGLPSSLGNYVYKIKNRVVFATEKGVYEYDGSLNKFVPSAFLTPIFGTMEIRYLKEDPEGNIWFCTGKQLGVVNANKSNDDSSKNKITYFPELTGHILTGAENVYPFNSENIFIGSEKGIIHLNYEKYVALKSKLNVLFHQVKAIGRSDSIIYGGHFIDSGKSSFVQNKILKLRNSYNSFHFEYSAPAYGSQNNIEYSYQLVGYDEKWSPWSSKTEKDYTNLPNGKYDFKVKAHDNLGNESEVIKYTFVVNPAWYNTIWAYLFYAILFLLVLYLLNIREKKKLQLQQANFDEEQKRLIYLHQLELEKNEKEIIKLQNKKLANDVVFKNKELADASMHLVERSDALAKVKDELQKLYKNTSNNNDVKKVIQLLNDVEKNNDNWEQFSSHFDEVNNGFLKKMKFKYPVLSNTDLKVCAYLQLNLSSKEIAQLMNISVRGVEISRYRLRKKLQISTEQTLNDFLNGVI